MGQSLTIALFTLATTAPTRSLPSTTDLETRIDAALAAAARFMIDTQSPDGAWRSQTYGCFRHDPALTPLVLSSLGPLAAENDEIRSALGKGISYLIGMVGEDGAFKPTGSNPWAFPVYTAAMASWVVTMDSPTEQHLRAQRAWLDYLRARRLGSGLGWRLSDPQFGGWGYATAIPRRVESASEAGTPFGSNLSATLFGLAALRFGRVPSDDPVYDEILIFVERCQNFSQDPQRSDAAFDDGGFFFSTTDAACNKAGIAGTDRLGRTRFRSYGSATADGLRALLLCGLDYDHPQVITARKWLERNFVAGTNPGIFVGDRKVLQDATYYYYCWSVAHALMALNIDEIETDTGPVQWAQALATELLDRQRPDGSWANRFTDAKEDDPLVASPFAAAALAICRRMLPDDDSGRASSQGIQPCKGDRVSQRSVLALKSACNTIGPTNDPVRTYSTPSNTPNKVSAGTTCGCGVSPAPACTAPKIAAVDTTQSQRLRIRFSRQVCTTPRKKHSSATG
ncbi:MAG: prenyltransferase/squalene oxidase repeat-containing protein, partial [Phycisphaerae bacterium]